MNQKYTSWQVISEFTLICLSENATLVQVDSGIQNADRKHRIKVRRSLDWARAFSVLTESESGSGPLSDTFSTADKSMQSA
jgi:hypothetical protein